MVSFGNVFALILTLRTGADLQNYELKLRACPQSNSPNLAENVHVNVCSQRAQ